MKETGGLKIPKPSSMSSSTSPLPYSKSQNSANITYRPVLGRFVHPGRVNNVINKEECDQDNYNNGHNSRYSKSIRKPPTEPP